MNEQPVIVRRICWQDLFPWMMIIRTLPVATSLTVLVLATLGVVLTPIGWIASESLFVTEELRDQDPLFAEIAELNRSPYRGMFRDADHQQNQFQFLGVELSGPRLVFQRLVKPFYSIFGADSSPRSFLYYLFGSIWSILIWSFFGVAITRVCLLRLTRDERAGIDDGFEYAFEKYLTAILSIGLPLFGIAIFCIPTFLLGLLIAFDLGTVIVGVFWFLVLGLAAMMAILLLGLLFGWPLMIASVACEGQNSFDAMTRSFAYVFQRPVHYVFYATIAILFGGFCWLVAATVTDAVVNLGYWSTGWGANLVSPERIQLIRDGYVDSSTVAQAVAATDQAAGDDGTNSTLNQTSKMLQTGRSIIGFWVGVARTICVAFLYGLFWCIASAIYLLLRRDVDETETDEIYFPDERRTYDLPPLKSDELGIPQVQPLDSGSENDPDDSDVA